MPFNVASGPVSPPHQDSGFGTPMRWAGGDQQTPREEGLASPLPWARPSPPSPALSLHMHKPALLQGVEGHAERASGACCPLTLQLEDPIGLSESRRAVQWNPEHGRRA